MVAGPGTIAVHSLWVVSTLAILIGSAAQAVTNLATYQEELEQLQLDEEVSGLRRPTPRVLIPWLIPSRLFVSVILDVIKAALRVRLRYLELARTGVDKRIRLRQLVLASAAWTVIMVGAFLALVAAAVQLAIDL